MSFWIGINIDKKITGEATEHSPRNKYNAYNKSKRK